MNIPTLSRALRTAAVISCLGLSAFVAPRALARVDVNINLGAEPPPPRHEVIVERGRPGPDYIWVSGYWAGRPGRYEWVAGHWDRPPHRGAAWVEPRWEMRGRERVFVKGYWRDGDERRDRDERHDDRRDHDDRH